MVSSCYFDDFVDDEVFLTLFSSKKLSTLYFDIILCWFMKSLYFFINVSTLRDLSYADYIIPKLNKIKTSSFFLITILILFKKSINSYIVIDLTFLLSN